MPLPPPSILVGLGQPLRGGVILQSLDVGAPVRDAPYSASASTEIVQRLIDGNRIVRKTSAAVYRDSFGRTRREETISAAGALIAADAPLTITITDPVSGYTYMLDALQQIALRSRLPTVPAGGITGLVPLEGTVPRPVDPRRAASVKTESLGTKTIEGLIAEGTRTTITMPAGVLGNERPLTTISERWFSLELQVVALSLTRDPRFGETTYRLTSISRVEPLKTLFEVPGGYRVIDRADSGR